jgi:hypothetical protein
MEVANDVLAAANRRGAAQKSVFPVAIAVRYDRRIARIVVSLESGLELAFSPH